MSIFFTHHKNLYLYRTEAEPSKGVHIYSIDAERKSAKRQHYCINPTIYRTYAIYNDKNDYLWIATSKGAKRVNEISAIKNDTSFILPNKKISTAYNDKEGNFWFTDLQNGIHIIPQLNVIRYDESNSALNDAHISKLNTLNDSILLIGTYSGNLFLFNIHAQKFELPLSIEKNKGNTVKDIEVHNGKAFVSSGKLLVYNFN